MGRARESQRQAEDSTQTNFFSAAIIIIIVKYKKKMESINKNGFYLKYLYGMKCRKVVASNSLGLTYDL